MLVDILKKYHTLTDEEIVPLLISDSDELHKILTYILKQNRDEYICVAEIIRELGICQKFL